MLDKNKIIQENTHFILIILLSFVMFLIILFTYLQNIEKTMKSYQHYRQILLKIDSSNQELNHVFLRSYRYIDNDMLSQIIEDFDKNLLLLKEYLSHKEVKFIRNNLKEIEENYQIKSELLKEFKILNIAITNTTYTLYMLKEDIEDTENNLLHKNKVLAEIFHRILFKIGQLFIRDTVHHLAFEKDITALKYYKNYSKNTQYFYEHISKLIGDIKLFEKILEKNRLLNLDQSIHTMDRLLEEEYIKNKEKKDMIAIIFFLSSFVMLLVLIYGYLKILSNRKIMYHLAYHDMLTKLPNRTHFEIYITTLIKDIQKEFILLFIDLDRFKIINDTLGHDVGDEILVIISQRISTVLGDNNFVARLGGDEFIAILDYKGNNQEVEALVENLIKEIRNPLLIREYSLNITASIGIVRYPDDGKTKQTLLKYADSAMYHAKDEGKDTYAFYNKQLSIDMHRRLELEQELLTALKKQEFSLVFQPQYDLKSKEITGAEALVRWKSDLLGAVSPEEFIAVAEDIGLIIELGYHIFREACLAYIDWKSQGVNIAFIAINISSIQLRQEHAFETFKTIIKETGINPKNIEVELTERYIMEYSTKKLTILDELRSIGCKISIDDFGTGYSSMSYLKRLSIDTIKIDKSFISDLSHNKYDAEVSKAMIKLSKTLGYQVIAEGIEEKSQETLLIEYGCDIGQGYYFSKPISSDEIVSFYYAQKNTGKSKCTQA